MTKRDYSRTNKSSSAFLNDPYWANPKRGFDKHWHNQRNKLQETLGIHRDHNWEIINKPTGPHAGKVICNSCEGKFVAWIPKGYFSSNT